MNFWGGFFLARKGYEIQVYMLAIQYSLFMLIHSHHLTPWKKYVGYSENSSNH